VSSNLEFALLAISDVEALIAKEVAASSHPWRAKMLGDSLSAGADCWHILRQGQPVGYCVLQRVLDEAELLNIVIFKPFQGRGLGKLAMHGLQASLASRGVQKLFLEVRRSNYVARRLYERSGFIQRGIRKAYYRSQSPDQVAEDAVLMVCELMACELGRRSMRDD